MKISEFLNKRKKIQIVFFPFFAYFYELDDPFSDKKVVGNFSFYHFRYKLKNKKVFLAVFD